MTKKHATSRSKRNNKTKRRTRAGTRRRSRSYGNRRTGVKRGGMLRRAGEAAKTAARTYFDHDVLPLLTRYHNYVGYNPHPSDGSVVKYRERYYNTFADIPIDEGTKATINILKNELNDLKDPVKNFDKIKSAYDKVISKLEEEKRAQEDKENGVKSKTNQTSTFSLSPFSSVSPFDSQHKGHQRTQRVGALSQIMNKPFGTPDTVRYPGYSSDSATPAKPRPKGTIGGVVDEDDDGTARVLFGVKTPQSSPIRSPPPPSSSNPSGPENKENELFSPVRKLPF